MKHALWLVGALVVPTWWACSSEFSASGSGGSGATGTGASATGGGGQANGGSGGDGGSNCVDADLDGATTCEGDCNDADPTSRPGVPEICGDGRDNDCDGTPDQAAVCQGIGTFVSSNIGDDSNPGTQAAPVQSIGQGMANAAIIGGGADVYVGEGHYSEKVVMVEGVDLLGGYQCDVNSCTWARDPKAYDSAILDQDFEGVLIGDGITRATRLEGFRIMGVSGNPGSGRSVAVSIAAGSPTLSQNRIFGGTVAGCAACGSIGVGLGGPQDDPAGALISGNTVQGATSTGYSQAIGIGALGTAELTRNTIIGGSASYTRALAIGATSTGNVVADNDISAGTCLPAALPPTTYAVVCSGQATFNANRVNTDPALAGTCATGFTSWSGGIELQGGSPTLTNNVVLGLAVPKSAGVFIAQSEIPLGVVIVNDNTVAAGGMIDPGGNSTSAAIVLRNAFTNSPAAVAARVRNNILLAGLGVQRAAVWEDDSPNGQTIKPEALENNDLFGFSVAAYRSWNGSSATNIATAQLVNSSVPNALNNFSGDPLLDGTYHLVSKNSPCVDTGTLTEAPALDFEGDVRPLDKIDVGADEYPLNP